MKYLYWTEQDNPDNPSSYKECTISEEDAIQTMKKLVTLVSPEFAYQSDQEALMDFIAVNWASYTPST